MKTKTANPTATPYVFNSIYSGESYDARREQSGWNDVDFDDSKWDSAKLVNPPGGVLKSQTMPPIRATKTFSPIKIDQPRPGVFVFDFGQNMAGYAQLNIKGSAGEKIDLKYGERLSSAGLVDQTVIAQLVVRYDSNQLFQTDSYTLRGHGQEVWHPRFAYYGFRYVEATGFQKPPGKETLTAVFTHTDVTEAGHFECSNPLLNRIWNLARWSYLSNLQGIPTDCPQREKNGWTGDAHLAAVDRANGHIDTGILGAKYLLNALLANGRADVAYRIIAQRTQPGWGWWVEQGATTMWEEWNGHQSLNHIMFGDVAAWFYKALAGINPDPQSPGFKHFFISPQVVGDLTSARGEYNSVRGKIISDWSVVKGMFTLNIVVPANTSASVSLPINDLVHLHVDGLAISNVPAIKPLPGENGRSDFLVESGRYQFTGPLAESQKLKGTEN